MKCRIIKIANNSLTTTDFNEYLDAWMAGEAPKLENFVALFPNLDLSIVMKDIECEVMNTEDNFTFAKGPYKIKREHDGRCAKVFGSISEGWHTHVQVDSFEFQVLE
uniref:FBA_2 domain-containing protein n=1 Tax=Caenorhabditis tropicalis TaxID=1561998 RepID=A0A1I7TLN1_9PELO